MGRRRAVIVLHKTTNTVLLTTVLGRVATVRKVAHLTEMADMAPGVQLMAAVMARKAAQIIGEEVVLQVVMARNLILVVQVWAITVIPVLLPKAPKANPGRVVMATIPI